MEKLIITAAITGAELSKEKCPVLPITPLEQGQAAREAVDAGASVIHLHVRNKEGKPSQKKEDFQAAVHAITEACQGKVPVIQFSTGGAVGEKIENRLAPLSLKPPMASLNLGSINFGEDVFINTLSDMRSFAQAFKENQITAEYEIYEAGHLDTLKKLVGEKVISAPFHCQFVLGVPGALMGDLASLQFLIQKLPSESSWGVAGIGRFQLPLAIHAILLGGHVRVGLEDNIFYSKGVPAKSNAQLVERIARLAREVGREIATPDEARKILLSH